MTIKRNIITILAGLVVTMALGIAIIVAAQVVSCPVHAEEAPPVTEDDDLELNADPPWDMEARAAVIRAEEAAKLQARVEASRTAPEPPDPLLDALTAGVIKLQPYLYGEGSPEARRLAALIRRQAEAHQVSPWLALAVARRESSLHPRVGRGHQVGTLGEVGYFQVIPGGAAERTCGRGCDQAEPECNARTAMCWLAHSRTECGTDPWVYVGAYGRRRCPRNAAEARRWPEVRRARGFLCEAMGASCVTTWPE